ncbi:DNA polymerase III subunit chi [Entomobacter blattae]|uniref:DNA polymerase III chi subunit, HolC n=1 Tax=Entomobacter blattae TaxID=2762277 RepID=A0A7H1NV04_9PROT|nr:DNA polymerase III subunit chi [Entomobacter blattae]QNT79614.1 DNA polymerase III chi subunit, HolC [Entomobacter blattae]
MTDSLQKTVQAGFYHLTRTGVKQALPLLLGKVLAGRQRAVVRCRDSQLLKALDLALWEAEQPFWLPHGLQGQSYPELSPIWLTVGKDVPNKAACLFLVDGADFFSYPALERIFVVFEDHNVQAVEMARGLWQFFKDNAIQPTYWYQDEKGWKQRQ